METFIEELNNAIEVNSSYAIIIPMLIGIFLAIVITYIVKAAEGKILKAIIKSKAETPETAVDIDSLGLNISSYTRKKIFKDNYGLGKMIKKTEDNKVYIPLEMQCRAGTVYGTKDLNPVSGLLILLGFLLFGYLLLKLAPMLLEFVEATFTSTTE